MVFAACLLLGCAPEPEIPRRRALPDITGRSLCGWDALMGQPPDVVLTPSAGAQLAAGTQLASLQASDEVTFAQIEAAIAPARDTLVRLKLVFDARWLLPLTLPARTPPPKPAPAQAHESVVGHRKITRHVSAPRERFADLRLDGTRVELFVENEAPGGEQLPLDQLKARLRTHDPPIGVLALTASDDTRWSELSRAVIAAACFDREPGEEPHEIILD